MIASLARSSSDAYSRASSSDQGRLRCFAHATETPYDPSAGRASDGTFVTLAVRGVSAGGLRAFLLGKDAGLVGGRAVHSWYRYVVKPQIHAELRAVMDEVIHHHCTQDCRTWHGHNRVATEDELPDLSQMFITRAGNG